MCACKSPRSPDVASPPSRNKLPPVGVVLQPCPGEVSLGQPHALVAASWHPKTACLTGGSSSQ
jgi:hypothetical protein